MNNSKTVKTWLPFFSGFCETIHSDKIDFWQELEEESLGETNMTQDEIYEKIGNMDDKINHKAVKQEYSSLYTDGFINLYQRELKEIGINEVRFESLYSPREYNFGTDTINVSIDVDAVIFEKYAKELLDNQEVIDAIKEEYTSRDGFSSFHGSDANEWKNDIFNEHKFAKLIEYYLQLENGEPLNRISEIDTDIYEGIEFDALEFMEED